jgi:hypothetical protein
MRTFASLKKERLLYFTDRIILSMHERGACLCQCPGCSMYLGGFIDRPISKNTGAIYKILLRRLRGIYAISG